MIQTNTERTPKKQWQKPDFYLLDSAHDINAKVHPRVNENTGHFSYFTNFGSSLFLNASKNAGNATYGVTNKSSAVS